MIAGRGLRAILVLALGGVVWILAETAYVKMQSSNGDPALDLPASIAAAPEVEIAAETTVVLPAQEEVSGIIERPMFSPSRRPVEAVVLPTEPERTADLEIDLIGIVIWQSERFALVRMKDQTVARVALGGSVAGWQAVNIAPHHVLFRSGARERELRLDFRNQGRGG